MAVSLVTGLQHALPKGIKLVLHHFSSLPVSTEPLFVAPLGTSPEATELERHFLSASVKHENGLVQAFALEVLSYTTATLTTLFVSKADSTGYLHALDLPAGTSSPIRTVIIEFLQFLVKCKQRKEARLVLSLFARAQDQYLFPGSIENSRKHVLDDRGLIKWWARILDQVLANESKQAPQGHDYPPATCREHQSRGHLVVPGCDVHEARTFIPRDEQHKLSTRWSISDPLNSIGKPAGMPERCLIPRFPDDPKARFAIDLDDELPYKTEGDGDNETIVFTSDRWRSIRSLSQFWELMSFRQECSAGRLVGFLWGIWEPEQLVGKLHQATDDQNVTDTTKVNTTEAGPPIPTSSQPELSTLRPSVNSVNSGVSASAQSIPQSAEMQEQPQPQIQEPLELSSSGHAGTDPPLVDAIDGSTVPPLIKHTPAEITLTADAYNRCTELLLTLDYCDVPTAVASTQRFLSAVAREGGKNSWGVEVVGIKEAAQMPIKSAAGEANSLVDVVRKRPKTEEANMLGTGLVRKKPKT